MIELLFVAQALRNPIQAIVRRWYCYGLFRAGRGAARSPRLREPVTAS